MPAAGQAVRALVVALLALALAGCSTPIAGTATAAPGAKIPALASAGASAPVVDTQDVIMVQVIRAGTSIPATQISDVRLVSIAQYVCGVIEVDSTRAGVTTAIMNVSMANSVGLPQAGFIVGASVGNKCPQFSSLVG